MSKPIFSKPAVVVVGTGLAGLSAAAEALVVGVPVKLLDRAPKPGGNSIKASSGINGAPTQFQSQAEGEDVSFWADTVRSAGESMNTDTAARERMITTLTNSSRDAINWLVEKHGVDLSVVAQLGGHSRARTHRGGGKTPPGAAIVSALLTGLKENPLFELITRCEVFGLVQKTAGGKVEGVEAVITSDGQGDGDGDGGEKKETVTFLGPVVFATGGFGGDKDGMLARHRPDLAGIPSTNDPQPGSHGILVAAGARLVDMAKVQVHPTGFVDPGNPDASVKFLAAEMLRGEGGILLRQGKRFVNEMETREHISKVIMKEKPMSDATKQWDVQLLLDPGACDAAASHIGFYIFKKLVAKVKLSELDEMTRQTVREYSAVVRGEKEDQFGRKAFGHWRLKGTADEEDSEEVCVGSVTPIVHFTMGGAVLDAESAAVLASDDVPIEGVWAAGEVTGGLHGDNRLGGSSLLECVVFGRRAGRHAAEYLVLEQQVDGSKDG